METASKPASLIVSVPAMGPATLGIIIRLTVHVPPGGTGVATAPAQLPPLIKKSGFEDSTSEGTNDDGPRLLTTRYHSGPG